jgi:hypothetical protein
MIIPSVGTIEAAADSIQYIDASVREEQRKQFLCALGAQATTMEPAYAYELGLQTARVLVANGPAPGATTVDL